MKTVVVKKNIVKGQCATRYCRKKTTGAKHCATCRSRISRMKDPVRYSYNNLKNRAGQRGKAFEITLEEFREICVKSRYIQGKGRHTDSFTLDRDKEELGYTKDNIVVRTLGNNIRKRFLSYDDRSKVALVWSPAPVVDCWEEEKMAA